MENNSFEYSEYIQNFKDKTSVRRTARLVGISYIVMLLISLLWFDAYMYFAPFFGLSISDAAEPFTDPAVLQIVQIIVSSLMFLFPYLIILAGGRERMSKLISFGKPDKKLLLPLILIAIAVFALANIATSAIASFLSTFGIKYTAPPIDTPEGPFGILLAILATAVTPALVEEFAIRGLLMGALKKHGEAFAIIASSIFFGLMHCNYMQIPFAFIGGLAIGYAVIKTDSFWTGVLIHFINNFVTLMIDMLTENIPSVNAQSFITAIYFAICFVCFFVGIFMLRNHNTKDLELKNEVNTLTEGQKYAALFTQPLVIIAIIATFAIATLSM